MKAHLALRACRCKRPVRWRAVGNVRDGVLVSLVNDQGRATTGGAWPLPPLSSETVHDILLQIKSLPKRTSAREWLHYSMEQSLAPSLRWAISSALWRLVHPTRAVHRHTAVLVEPHDDFSSICRHHSRCLKLKLKAPINTVDSAFGWIQTHLRHHKETLLRLDAQQQWMANAILELHERLLKHGYNIDYWEDPCPADQLALLETIAPKLAVDVSNYQKLSLLPSAPQRVVKAAICGSVWEFLHLLKASSQQCRIIVSSTGEGFEAAQLLAELSPVNVVHGFWPMTLGQTKLRPLKNIRQRSL